MLIIFDTCTKPDYYKDVHKVLASPTGSIVRYDYERRLWTEEAQALAESILSNKRPIPALLVYGQVKDFKKGNDEPTFMLTSDNAIFIPTRCAKVVNFSIEPHTNKDRENLYLHLELDGFLRPDNTELQTLISELEAKRQLPFDRDKAYKWVSACPDKVNSGALLEAHDENWPLVVDKFASSPSQFVGDVFWRVEGFDMVSSNTQETEIKLGKRQTNKIGSKHNFHNDYTINDLNEYAVSVRNYIPVAEERELPPHAAISAREDTSKLLSLPEHSVALRRNATDLLKVGVSQINFLNRRYAKLVIVTELPDHKSDYPAGSLVDLTVELQKSRSRMIFAFLAAIIAIIAMLAAVVLMRQDFGQGMTCVLLSLILFWAATWLWTDEVNPLKRS